MLQPRSELTLAEKLMLAANLEICNECEHYIKLAVCWDEGKYYIGQTCNCGPHSRLSVYYDKRIDAATDLCSFSWKD